MVEFAPRPWRQSHRLLLEIIGSWFTGVTPSYQSRNNFTRSGHFLREDWETQKQEPVSCQSHWRSQKKSCWFPQYWPQVVELIREERDSQGWERVSRGAAGKTEWVCVVLSRVQDSQRHHCSDWWRTPRTSLFLFREGGKRWSGLCLSKQTWKRASSFWNGLQSFYLVKMIIVFVKLLNKIVSHM